MLEQAIIDAQSLREAAIKNAESEIVEKYSNEVKKAVSRLLEQDEDLGLGLDMDLDAEEEEVSSTAMEQVPMAHISDGAEDIVEVDLDDIIAAAQSENDEEDFELGRDEIADEIGIDLSPETETPANRNDEEISLEEGDLLDLFKELLVVDVPEKAIEDSVEEANKEEVEDDEELIVQDKDVAVKRPEGMDKEDIEEQLRFKKIYKSLQKENKDLKSLLGTLKEKLEDLHIQNARLLYTNRVHENTSLNERQKNKIVEMLSNTRSVDEARVIFNTLQKTMAGISNRKAPESLSEAVTKRSSVILGTRRDEQVSQQNPTTDRWAILAGLKDN